MCTGYYEADHCTYFLIFIGAGAHQPLDSGVAAARSGVTPANGLSIIVGEESVHPILLDKARGLTTTLGFSLVVCKMIGRTVTVRPVRIVRKPNTVEEL